MSPTVLYSVMHAYNEGRHYRLKHEGFFSTLEVYPPEMFSIY